jgi:hypothetical protein
MHFYEELTTVNMTRDNADNKIEDLTQSRTDPRPDGGAEIHRLTHWPFPATAEAALPGFASPDSRPPATDYKEQAAVSTAALGTIRARRKSQIHSSHFE